MPNEPIRVLLVEDDEDDYILTTGLLAEISHQRFEVEWLRRAPEGIEAMAANRHDVCLVDYHLGAENGIQVLRAALERGCQAPVILLTGQGEHEIDLEAMKAGAADYLIKGRIEACVLERSIRYAIERRLAVSRAAAEQTRLAAFGAEVGLALTRRDSLDAILRHCGEALVRYLHAALARIWTYDESEKALKCCVSVCADEPSRTGFQPVAKGFQPVSSRSDENQHGLEARGDRLEACPTTQPKLSLPLDQLAQGRPILINQVAGDPRVIDPAWAAREGIVAYAGYPLMLEDRLVGMMSIFSRTPLTQATIQEMASVANGIALCIERKRSEQALDASEVKYRVVVENIREVIFQLDGAGRWTFLNPAWTEITGFRLCESLGRPFAEFIHPEDRARHREQIEEVLQRKISSCREEMRWLARDGGFRWVELCAQPLLGSESDPSGLSGTLIDITERKRAEAEIEKLAAFPRFNPDPVLEFDAEGKLSFVNDAAHEMVRLLQVEQPEAILPPGASGIAEECLRTGQSRHGVDVALGGRTLSWDFFPIASSRVVHCYGTDITERLGLEAQLRHSQKLDSIGQLAAGVAHDFNNILTVIQGHADRLLARKDGDVRFTDPLQQVANAARRASSLTRQLLMFSRKQVMQPRVLDLNAVLDGMTKLLQRLLGDDVELQAQAGAGLPNIEADAGMIEQVIMNLAVNARDAMPRGGQLVIATTSAQIDAAYVQQHSEARAGSFVCLSVTDTGCGIPEEIRERIFEPFFTTKEVGKGTGLGLATVYGIVKQHQGWLELQSTLNVGTTFRIYLPATTKACEAAVEKTDSRPSVRGGKETILLVEDEPVLRELASTILGDYQYTVLEAGTGREALQVFDQHQGRIDLLLTDMVMPQGMTGRELADTLKTRKPGLKVIYTSGYSADVMGGELNQQNIRFLQKPYAPPKLAQVVRECLDF